MADATKPRRTRGRLHFRTAGANLVAARWSERFESMVAAGERHPRTLKAHRFHLDHDLLPRLFPQGRPTPHLRQLARPRFRQAERRSYSAQDVITLLMQSGEPAEPAAVSPGAYFFKTQPESLSPDQFLCASFGNQDVDVTLRVPIAPGCIRSAHCHRRPTVGGSVDRAGWFSGRRRADSYDPSLLHISMVFVHPAAQRTGVGLPLILHVFDVAASLGYQRVGVWTSGGNTPARKLYERAGMTLTGKSTRALSRTHLQYECLLNGESAPRPEVST